METANKIRTGLFLAILVLAMVLFSPKSQAFSQTKVLVAGCTVEDGGLAAGKTSTVTLMLKNTSDRYPVLGVLVTGQWVDVNAPVEFELTNQAFAGTINPNQEVAATFSVVAKTDSILPVGSIPCNLYISYTEDGQIEHTNTVVVQVPVYREPSKQAGIQDNGQGPQPLDAGQVPRGPRPRYYIFLAGACLCAMGSIIVLLTRGRQYQK